MHVQVILGLVLSVKWRESDGRGGEIVKERLYGILDSRQKTIGVLRIFFRQSGEKMCPFFQPIDCLFLLLEDYSKYI